MFNLFKFSGWFLYLSYLLGFNVTAGTHCGKPDVKGNITVMVFPQENPSSSNDSNMVIAVKSDCKVLTEDLHLLNLVVQVTTTTTRAGVTRWGGGTTRKPSTGCPKVTSGLGRGDGNDFINRQNTARYFMSARNMNVKLTPISGNGSDTEKPLAVDSNTRNLYTMLGFNDTRGKVDQEGVKTSLNSTSDGGGDVMKFLAMLNAIKDQNVTSNNSAKTQNSSSNKYANEEILTLLDIFNSPKNNHTSNVTRQNNSTGGNFKPPNNGDDPDILKILKMLNVPANNSVTSNLLGNSLDNNSRFDRERKNWIF